MVRVNQEGYGDSLGLFGYFYMKRIVCTIHTKGDGLVSGFLLGISFLLSDTV